MTAPTHDHTQPQPLADASMLEDKVPESLKLSRVVAGLTALLSVLFFAVSTFWRLWHTDLWGHLAYGRIIAGAKSIPATEPLMPLCVGVPFIDTAWLTQVTSYAMFERYGFTSLGFLYAASVTAMSALLVYRGYQRSQSVGLTLCGWLLWMWGCWTQLSIVRPQLAGMLCFATLLVLVTSRHPRLWHWFAVPLLFVVWANCHGSFLVGLVLLATLAVGRAVDLAVRCGEFRAIRRDSQVRRFVLLLELAAAAVLINPYGLRLYAEVLTIANHPNMAELGEWQPLSLRMPQGQAVAAIGLLLVVLYRLSPRRVTAAEVMLLFGFGSAALWSSRMIVWWVPLATYFAMLHASAVWHAWVSPLEQRDPSSSRGLWTVVTLGAAFVGFGLTPFGGRFLHGNEGSWKLQTLVSRQTPLAIVKQLNEMYEQKKLPRGLMFNTYEWGDYLLWAGSPELQQKVFVASHVHLVPREVWQDYIAISNVSSGWEDLLDRYGINLIVLDESTHDILIRRLRENENWRANYSDNVGAVFVRRKPI